MTIVLRPSGICRKLSVSPCDLCASVVILLEQFHHRDTEIFTEARRFNLFLRDSVDPYAMGYRSFAAPRLKS
jgi:hypothetical protein